MIPADIFAVYQAIYYDYFRLSNWEINQTLAYNLDSGYNGLDILASGLPWSTSMGLRELVQLRHRPWYKDYFTNVFPNPLISSTGLLSTGIANLQSINQWLVSSQFTPIGPYGNSLFNGSGTTVSPVNPSAYSDQYANRSVSTATLRTLFAVDKLLKVTARAGKHYDDQVLAHFGFKVPQGYSKECVHIGVHHQQIHIGEVISTASTATGEIGELAGKGYGKKQSRVVSSFTAPCHGYIMAVYSCVPKISYVGGLDRLHSMTMRYDWFIPELDNLGMQPLFEYEFNVHSTTPTNRLAWQLRYYQLKNKKPRATYAFASTCFPLSGAIANIGPFGEWCLTDPFPEGGLKSIELGRLLVSPCLLSELTLVSYDPCPSGSSMYDGDGNPLPGNLYYSDPLIHHCIQSVSKISGMSVYGLDDKAI